MENISTLNSSPEAKPLKLADIEAAIGNLKNLRPDPYAGCEIRENATPEQLMGLFGGFRKQEETTWQGGAIGQIYGFRVIEDKDLPEGELRFVNQYGEVLRRFNFNS